MASTSTTTSTADPTDVDPTIIGLTTADATTVNPAAVDPTTVDPITVDPTTAKLAAIDPALFNPALYQTYTITRLSPKGTSTANSQPGYFTCSQVIIMGFSTEKQEECVKSCIALPECNCFGEGSGMCLLYK